MKKCRIHFVGQKWILYVSPNKRTVENITIDQSQKKKPICVQRYCYET